MRASHGFGTTRRSQKPARSQTCAASVANQRLELVRTPRSAGKSPVPELDSFGGRSAAASGAATVLVVCAIHIKAVTIVALDLFEFRDAATERAGLKNRFFHALLLFVLFLLQVSGVSPLTFVCSSASRFAS